MRARLIRPEFFTDSKVCKLPLAVRILFQGLWCLADREGKLVDQPEDIKFRVMPADDLDIDQALQLLEQRGFIQRYAAENMQCIAIKNFLKHQAPHHTEKKSVLPELPALTVSSPLRNREPQDISKMLIYGSSTCTSIDIEDRGCRGEETLTVSSPLSNREFTVKAKTPSKTPRVKTTSKSKPEPLPLWPGCEHFRMDAHGYELARQWYAKERLPETLLPHAIKEVDSWLGTTTKTAKAACTAIDHHEYLYKAWALENAQRSLAVCSNGGKKETEYERKRREMRERQARLEEEAKHGKARNEQTAVAGARVMAAESGF
jgi:hypothetical protein